MSHSPVAPEPTLDARYVAGKLRANLPLILGLPLLLCAGALLYTFLAPPVYRAETTLYFPKGSSSVLGAVGVTSSESAGGLAGLSSGPTPIKIFRRFMESETCLEFVSQKSGIKPKGIIDNRKFEEDSGANMLTITITLPDGDKAKGLLQDHLKALALINERISSDYLADDTSSIQKELAAQKGKLDEAEKSLVAFQRKANSAPTNAPSEWQARLLQAKIELASTRSSIKAASAVYRKSLNAQGLSPSDIPPVQKLRPKLVDAEYQLNVLLKSLGPDAPEVRHLTTEIDNLKRELQSEVAAYVSSINKGLVDPTRSGSPDQMKMNGMLDRQVALEAEVEALTQLAKVAPTEQGTLAHLALEVTIQSELVKQATLQLEAAKLQSLRDPNKWSLLDPPWVDPNPTNKRFLPAAAIAILAGLLVSLLWAFNFGRKPKPA
ncbi:hypothetical protein BH11ARM2_BH11ARM2_10590 [soil metagenome]